MRVTARLSCVSGIEELRDAEVEQARPSVRTDEQVARLQVAVDDAAPMGELDRFEDGGEELEPARQGKRLAPEVGDEILALDVLERQEPGAVGGAPALDEAGDPRMLERRQDAHLVAEAAQGVRRQAIDDFEGDRAPEVGGLLFSEVDAAHAAAAELAEDAIGADPLRRRGIGGIVGELFGAGVDRPGRLVEQPARSRQRRRAGAPPRRRDRESRPASSARKCSAPVFVERQRLGEELRQRLVAQRPPAPPPESSATSQARANCQSRFTVAGERSRQAAISSISSPAK